MPGDTKVAEQELEPTLGVSALHELNRHWKGMKRVSLVKSLTNHGCGERPRHCGRKQQEITKPRERLSRGCLGKVRSPAVSGRPLGRPRRRRQMGSVSMVPGRRRKAGRLPASRCKGRAAGLLCGRPPCRLRIVQERRPARRKGQSGRTVGAVCVRWAI